jgi:beta-glucosidase
VLHGRYPSDARAEIGPPDRLIRDGDMNLIAGPIDFLGVNYYRTHYVRLGNWSDLRDGESRVPDYPGVVHYLPPELPRTVMGWNVEPDGLYDVLMRLRAQAPDLPLYITENGYAAEDYVTPEGDVNDFGREAYLQDHLDAAWRAMSDGVKLAGYFHWSLMDNFEWTSGYKRRFGLYFVDFGTQRRLAKRSAAFYADVIRRGELPVRAHAPLSRDPGRRAARPASLAPTRARREALAGDGSGASASVSRG